MPTGYGSNYRVAPEPACDLPLRTLARHTRSTRENYHLKMKNESMRIHKLWFLVLLMAVVPAFAISLPAKDLENDLYRIRLKPDGAIEVSRKDNATARVFFPNFTLLSRQDDPGYELSNEREVAYRIPTWKSLQEGKTRDLFEAASQTRLSASRGELKQRKIHWRFPGHPQIALEAELELPPGSQDPKITFQFTPRQPGWYSLGYSGAPEIAPEKLVSLWQPLVWQERRFPQRSFFSIESMCSVPAVLAQSEGGAFGVAADPKESPFRQPTHKNSLFGVLLRNAAGKAQPMIFAPVLGLGCSKMEAGASFSFSFRLVLHPGDCLETFRYLARGLYGFHDYRENGTCSLNETLENMIDFAMNDQFCGWIPDLRGSDFSTDIPGSVKNVSALHPLSIALITDNEEIYRRRALPMTEYMLSRQKYLFMPREDRQNLHASHFMKGPAAEVSELVSLFHMFQGRTEVFRHHALDLYDKPRELNLRMVSEGASWQNSLALFRLTGERSYLQKAVAGANAYITKRLEAAQVDFSDVHISTGGQFWTDFAPKWVDLFELYEETKDERYLQAALQGAKLFSTYVWMQPCVPEEDVLINKGGKVGMYYVSRIHNPQPMRAPEQWVPAWRVSQVGLMPEASATYAHNPSVFLAHHAPYMLRLGYLSHDSFFHDLARSAVVGRYANFPGYDSNGEYTTLYQRPDYPLRPWRELTYNNVFYNHVWPLIAVDMDFLVSDAYVRSLGQIEFPSRYAQGYAYLQSKVYGDRPGTFYGDKNVRLWLPRKMLRTDTIQANYVAGYGNGNFYLALLNQSRKPLNVNVKLNPDIVPVNVSHSYKVQVWRDNQLAKATALDGGEVTVRLNPGGITALKVAGLKVSSQFQDRVFGADSPGVGKESFAMQETAFGKVSSMLLSMSPAITSAYVWLEATPRQVKEATLHYKLGKSEKTIQDSAYPYDFSVPLSGGDQQFESWIEAITADGATVRSDVVRLK
jgi:hypothetical protein